MIAVAVAVHRKASEDRAGDLAAVVAFYGFFSLFPLLLLLGTILGFVLDSHPGLRTDIVDAAVSQFPQSPELRDAITQVDGNGVALVIGLVGTLWGSFAVVNALRSAFDDIWAVPIRERAGLLPATLRNLAVVTMAAIGLVGSAALGAISDIIGDFPLGATIATNLAGILVSGLVFLGVFWFLSPRDVPLRHLAPGVVLVTVGWWVLQRLSATVIAHQLGGRGAATGVFAAGAVLLAWLALQARLTMLGVALNAVLARGWWPRALEPVAEHEGDRRVLKAHARTEERIPAERVEVRFTADGESREDASSDEPARRGA